MNTYNKTKIRNIKSKWEKLSHLLDKVETMIDTKEINATELISVVREYKRIKSVEEEDMQQAQLKGEQSIDDVENQLIDDLLLKLADAERQIFEVKYHLKRRCYISSDAKIDFALKPLQEVKEIVSANCR